MIEFANFLYILFQQTLRSSKYPSGNLPLVNPKSTSHLLSQNGSSLTTFANARLTHPRTKKSLIEIFGKIACIMSSTGMSRKEDIVAVLDVDADVDKFQMH